MAGGFLWLLLCGHQLVAHGPTEENEKNTFLGLTWMDSAKFFVVPFALFLVAVAAAYRLRGRATALGPVAFWVTAVSLAVLVIGTAIQFWPFPWGSYAEGYDEPHARYGGVIQAVASLVLTVGLLAFAVELARTQVIPWWAATVLVLGGPTTVFLSPAFPVPGVAWLVFGAVLALRSSRDPREARLSSS